MGIRSKKKILMRKIKEQEIRVRDESKVEEFLQNKGIIYQTNDDGQVLNDEEGFPIIDNGRSSGTAKGYIGDLKKFKLFIKIRKKPYQNLTEFANQVRQQNKKNVLVDDVSEQINFGENEITDYINWLSSSSFNQTAQTIKRSASTVQSFLTYCRVSLDSGLINYPKSKGVRRNRKHQWKSNGVLQFIESSKSLRDRAIIACAYQSGLSVSDLLEINYGDVKNQLYEPPMIIPMSRIKTGVGFNAMFGEDACVYLDLYLKSRIDLEDDSPLFASEGTMINRNERVDDSSIHNVFRVLADKNNIDGNGTRNAATIHSLRTSFISNMSKVGMNRALVEYLAGHNLKNIDKTYLNYSDEDLREAYLQYFHAVSLGKKIIKPVIPDRPPEDVDKLLIRIGDLESGLRKQVSENDKYTKAQRDRIDSLETQLGIMDEEKKEFREYSRERDGEISNLKTQFAQMKAMFEDVMSEWNNPDRVDEIYHAMKEDGLIKDKKTNGAEK